MDPGICRACQAGNHWECYLPECECGCDPDLFDEDVQGLPLGYQEWDPDLDLMDEDILYSDLIELEDEDDYPEV